MAIPSWLTEVMGWIPLVLILGATLICLMNMQLSRRMPLLALGFIGLALADLGFRFVQAMLREQRPVDVAMYFSILLIVRVVCWGLIVAGLAAVFRDIHERDAPAAPRNETSDPKRRPWDRD